MQSITLSQLRKIVNEYQPQLSNAASPKDARLYVGISDIGDYKRQDISDALRRRVVDSFVSGHHQVWTQIKTHLNDLIHEHIIHKAQINPYFNVLYYLQDCMRSNNPEEKIVGSWDTALKTIIDYIEWSGNLAQTQNTHMFQAEYASAYAMKRLRKIGKSWKLCSKPSDITEAKLQEIFNVLERYIQSFGGIELANHLFFWLLNYYDHTQMRYHYVTQLGLYHTWEPKIPIGLLINLAAKHPLGKRSYKKNAEDWKRIVQLSQDFACLYSVQPSNIYSGLFNSPSTVLQEMRRIALHDALFSPVQLRPTDVLRILNGLINWFRIEGKFSASDTHRLDSALTVLSAIQSILKDTHGPVKLTLEVLSKLCPNISLNDLKHLLDNVFAHPIAGVNQNFKSITEVSDELTPKELRVGTNFINRPLLTISKDTYVVLDYSICAPAMIESILALIRPLDPNAELGLAIEHMLSKELESHNVDVITGTYKDDNKTYECDLIIENSTRIMFIETKAKALTRAGRSASDVSLLKDIVDSLVHATIQSGRHSVKIFKDKSIPLLTKTGEVKTIELGNRTLERLAVTLHDFGGFQDRIVIDQILQNHMAITYHAIDKQDNSKIKAINKKLNELKDIYMETYVAAGSPEGTRLFFNCWFLSVPQFLILLDDVSDSEGLERELRHSRHITYGTNDFYYELKLVKKLHSSTV